MILGIAEDAWKRINRSVQFTERREQSAGGRQPLGLGSGSPVWVKPVSVASGGVHPAKFQRWSGTAWEDADEPNDCDAADASGGSDLDVGTVYMGAVVWQYPESGGVLVKVVGSAAVASGACRSMLVGIGPDTCLTGSVSGVGKCAMIAAASVGMVYYPATDTLPARWVSDPFTTAGGETTATVYTDTAGDPRATLTVAGETGPLTYLGCDGQGRLRFAGFDCLWCSGTWAAGPCGENKLYLAVACGCDPVSLCSCDVPRVFALAYRLEPSVGASADFVDLATAVTATYVLRYFPTGTYIEYGTHYYVVTSAAGEWFGAFQIGEGTAYAGWLLFRFILDSGTCIWSIAADFFADDGGTSNPLSYETYLCTAGVDEWDCSPFSGSTGCDVNHSGGSPSNLADAFFDWGPDVEYDDCAQDSGSGTGSGGGGPDPDPPAVGCCTGAGEALEAFPDLDLTIPDGPYAGTVTFTYSGSGGGVPSWDGPGGARVECSYGGTLVLQASTAAGSGVAWATAVACDPFGAVFPGTVYGATGDLTLELA